VNVLLKIAEKFAMVSRSMKTAAFKLGCRRAIAHFDTTEVGGQIWDQFTALMSISAIALARLYT
jgi:hypothetical protein